MLSFQNPSALWLLTTLAVPVILHLLHRQKLQTIVFPTTRFLRLAQIPRDGRQKLNNILLLILRMATMAAVILLIAKPTYTKRIKLLDEDDKTAVIVLDTSASMATQDYLEQAKNIAEDTAKSLKNWKLAAVIADNAGNLFTTPSTNHDDALKLINDAKYSYLHGKHRKPIEKALALLGNASTKSLILISDFQYGDWAEKLEIVPDDVKLELKPTTPKQPRNNVAITQVDSRELGNQKIQSIVTLRNFTPTTQSRTVTVTTPGNTPQQAKVTLNPHALARTAFVFDKHSNDGQAKATIDHDDYPIDDQIDFWTIGFPPLKALVVAENENDEQLIYLEKTFNATAEQAQAAFDTKIASVDTLDDDIVQTQNIIAILSCATELDNTTWPKLKAFLENGGLLIVTPGDSPAADLATLKNAGWDIAQANAIAKPIAKNASLGIAPIDQDSPFAQIFKDHEKHDLFTFPIRKHVRLKTNANTTTLIKSLDNLPLAIQHRHKQGNLVFFAFAFDRSWSDFPLTNSFLPLIRELVAALVPQNQGKKRFPCGQVIQDKNGNLIDTTKPSLAKLDDLYIEITPDYTESSIDTINLDDARKLLVAGGQSVASIADDPAQPKQFHKLCAFLAIAFFATELIVSAYSDKTRRRQKITTTT